MKIGLRKFFSQGIQFFSSNTANFYVGIKSAIGTLANWYITLPANPPDGTKMLSIDSSGNLDYMDVSAVGSVKSIGLSAPSDLLSVLNSPVTVSGVIVVNKVSQLQNLFYASPNGSSGDPSFRSLVYADLTSIIGTTANTLAAGNDSRLHNQNTDTGTSSPTFQIGSSGPLLKNNLGALEIRNNADNDYANLRVKDLTVFGSGFRVEAEVVDISDNIITLNSNVTTGTPNEDGGIRILRGSSTPASLLWKEDGDFWAFGLEGQEIKGSRTVQTTFTNGDLVAAVFTYNHGLPTQICDYKIADGTNYEIGPDNVYFVASGIIQVDLSSFVPITGTYKIICVG